MPHLKVQVLRHLTACGILQHPYYTTLTASMFRQNISGACDYMCADHWQDTNDLHEVVSIWPTPLTLALAISLPCKRVACQCQQPQVPAFHYQYCTTHALRTSTTARS